MNGDFVQKLASGSNDLVLSTGETFEIPPVARKFLRTCGVISPASTLTIMVVTMVVSAEAIT